MQIPDINIPCIIQENYLRIDDQRKLNPEASISVRDSTSTNDVDYILLNNDEVNTQRDILSETKVEVMLEHWNEGIPE
jgi:hypothetical protein